MNTLFKSDNAFCARQVRKAVKATGLEYSKRQEFQNLLLDYGRTIKTCDKIWSAEKKAIGNKGEAENGQPKLSSLAIEQAAAFGLRDTAAAKAGEFLGKLTRAQQDAFFGRIIKMNMKTRRNWTWTGSAATIGAFTTFVASLYSQFWVAAVEAVLVALAAKARQADKTAANLLVEARKVDEKKFDSCWKKITAKHQTSISESPSTNLITN